MAFVIYFVALIVIGVHFWRTKERDSMEDYILGGRSFGPYVSAMSAQASDMSGWLLMGLPGSIVLAGLGQAWIGIGLLIGSYTSWLFVARRLRKHSVVSNNALTMPEFFSNRFADSKGYLRIICAVVILFFFTIYVGSGFQSCGIVLDMLLSDGGFEIGIIVGAAVIILYTFLGGYKALCWTDFFQAILMVVVIVMVPLVIVGEVGWDNISAGWNTIETTMGLEGYTSLLYNDGMPITLVVVISGLAWGLGYYGMPHIVVRYMSIRKVSEIKVARRVSLVWGILALSFVCLIAIIAGVYLPENGIDIFDTSTYNSEYVFMYTAQVLFQESAPFILGVVFAAILAAIMSTASSQLLVSASSVTNDILAKSDRFHISERTLMWIARGIVVVISLIGMCLALFGSENIMGLVSYAWAGFGSAFSPVMILALFWKRMNWQGALAAMVTGFAVVVFWETFMDFTGLYSLFPGFILAFIVGVAVALLTPPPSKEVVDDFEAAQAYEDPERSRRPLRGPPTPRGRRDMAGTIADYDTVDGVREAEMTLKGSRFIGILMPCPDEAAVQSNLADVSSRHRDATHYCYAAVYGGSERRERSSDNGEPSGTAGRPILSVLRGTGLSDAMVVVVRYFGGTLLGTGGLVHAYTGAAKMAVEGAPRVKRRACAVYSLVLDYADHSVLESKCRDLMASRPECEYAERVGVRVRVPVTLAEEFERRIVDLTERRARPVRLPDEYLRSRCRVSWGRTVSWRSIPCEWCCHPSPIFYQSMWFHGCARAFRAL